MNEYDLVSIIVPVYNGEKHLNASLKSICFQTYRHIETIVVDDGSTDNTESIITACVKEDPRIRLIKIKNSGPAQARNIGLQQAQGDYVMFVDGDDKLEKNAVERALQAAQKNKCDLVIFGYSMLQQEKVLSCCGLDAEINSAAELGEWLSTLYVQNLLNQIWNKLYRRDVLHQANIRFLDYRYGEDRLFVFDILNRTQNICVISDSLYRYYQHPGTLVSRFYSKKFEVCSLIDESLLVLASKTGAIKSRDNDAYDFMFLKSVISCLVNLYEPACHYSRVEREACIRQILFHPRVIQALKMNTKHYSKAFLLSTRIMKTQSLALNRISFCTAAWTSRNLPNFFLSSRQNCKSKVIK